MYLSPAPIYHTAPAMWTMAAQAVGATTVVMERFDAEQALDSIERYGVTHAQFVPSMFVRMLRLPERDAAALRPVEPATRRPCRRAVSAGDQAPDDRLVGPDRRRVLRLIRRCGHLVHPRRGMARASRFGRQSRCWAYRTSSTSVGSELPVGEVGEIYYEGGYPFEYLNDQAKTAASRSPEGWVTVGDVGYVDDDGYLYLTDRRNHMIISGGVNIYPQEAENMLISHPLVVDAAVFGVPDDEMGQSVKAVVELVDPARAGDDLAAELIAWLRDRLAHYKCPRSISFEAQLPRTDAGKLYKQGLIDKYG